MLGALRLHQRAKHGALVQVPGAFLTAAALPPSRPPTVRSCHPQLPSTSRVRDPDEVKVLFHSELNSHVSDGYESGTAFLC